MKVLFYPRRAAPQQRGGDFIALEETIRALETRGVECTISTDADLDLALFDVVHLYSLGDPYSALPYTLNAQRQHKPIVTTPIYWRHNQWLDARKDAETYRTEHSLSALSDQERKRAVRLIEVEEEIYTEAHRLVIQLAARVLALSERERAIFASDFGAGDTQVEVTYNGVTSSFAAGDADRFLQTHHIPTRDFVLSVARVDERKNTMGLIRAWNDAPVPLVLIGRAPNPAYLEMCRTLAKPHIYFLGALPPSEVADAGAAAKVHVMASWWEEQGMAALEAGLAGCNLVMTKNGPGREYFGDACFTCDPADEASIRAAIEAALAAPRNPALAERIRKTFTWDAAADVLARTYEQAVREEPRAVDTAVPTIANLKQLLCERRELEAAARVTLEKQLLAQQAWTRELEQMAAAQRHSPAERALGWLQKQFGRSMN